MIKPKMDKIVETLYVSKKVNPARILKRISLA
jgi:hypothetical protein